jgi:hypothetical protein
MPPEVLIFTSFRQRVVLAVVRQRVVLAVVRQRVAAVVHQRVAAVVVHRQVVAVVRQQVVPQAFADKKLPTELCLPLQAAIAFSFCLPPKKFCFLII